MSRIRSSVILEGLRAELPPLLPVERSQMGSVPNGGRLSDERQKLFPQAGSEMSSVCDVESYFTN